MEWKEEDGVTTTAGTIWLAQRQAYNAGVSDERTRIVNLIEQEAHNFLDTNTFNVSTLLQWIKEGPWV
jgi:hypothetical protein